MEARNAIIATAGAIITVQVGLFAWLKSDISNLAEQTRSDISNLAEQTRSDMAGLGTRVDRVEREVAFIRGQLSLALPTLAAQTAADPESEP